MFERLDDFSLVREVSLLNSNTDGAGCWEDWWGVLLGCIDGAGSDNWLSNIWSFWSGHNMIGEELSSVLADIFDFWLLVF